MEEYNAEDLEEFGKVLSEIEKLVELGRKYKKYFNIMDRAYYYSKTNYNIGYLE